MPLILGANSLAGGYQVKNSLRFNSGSSDYLTKTFGSNGTRTTWTYSLWTKRSNLGANTRIMTASDNLTFDDFFRFTSSDTIQWDFNNSSASLITTQVFRDVSAWYHIVVACNTTEATSSNRMKLYVNGSQITNFGTATYPSQNSTGAINSTVPQNIGVTNSSNLSQFYNGYMSEINFIDGQALTPSSFGETDEDTGIWKPKAYTGTFGTNGFYLDFEDSANLGNDMSGNNNDFTVNNLTSIDQTTDTPTNNFCTLNPLATNSNITLSEGNLKAASSFTTDNIPSYGTIGVTTGKWYWEVKLSAATFNTGSGIAGVLGGTNIDFSTGYRAGLNGVQISTATNGTIQNDNVNTSNYFGGAISNGDILGVALDATNKQLKFNLNGGSFGSDLNFNATYTLFIPATDVRASSGTPAVEFNFGSPPFTIASGNADGNNFGNFEYAVPSGYYALCTKNLAEFG